MHISTWNVNSIRARQDRVIQWLERHQPDVLCLQELKVTEADFPFDALRAVGYHATVHGQPTYNGVAVLSREEPAEVRSGMADGGDDAQARLVAALLGDVWVLSAYFPNGGEVGSDKWAYKLDWMRRLRAHLDEHYDPTDLVALCGDFNVAPFDDDSADPAAWADTVLCHPEARAAVDQIRDWGFVDVVRRQFPDGGVFTWWDYRGMAFQRDHGLRIDHVFATHSLAQRFVAAAVDRDERSGTGKSDHVPVSASFAIGGLSEDAASGNTTVDTPSKSVAEGAWSGVASTGNDPSDAPKKLLLVDGHSVAYRAFYGMPLYDRRGAVTFSTQSGEFTNAVYGFTNMLIKTWNEQKPDYMAVAFDLGRTFRDDMFEDYKATREKMPDELRPQIDRIIEIVEAFDIPAITADGFEADDILGTLAGRGAREGLDVLIVTGDSDSFQLIEPRVRVLAPGRLWSETAIHDEEAVRERYGLSPAQLIDYKALCGDTSDNIPGVRGVGPKTAEPLLQKYGTLDAIYEHVDEVEPARARNALAAGREMAFLSRDLVTIRRDVPIDVAWQDCAVHTYDRGKVEALFDVLEFRTIRNRLPEGGVVPDAAMGGPDADGAPAESTAEDAGSRAAALVDGRADGPSGRGGVGPDAQDSAGSAGGDDARSAGGDDARSAGEDVAPAHGHSPTPAKARGTGQLLLFGTSGAESGAASGEIAAAPRNAPDTRAIVVADADALRALVDELRSADMIAFDLETTSTDVMRAEIVGIALAVEEGIGYYVPVGHRGDVTQLDRSAVLEALRDVLADPDLPKVAHNAKYDIDVLKVAEVDVAGLAYDTMLAEFLIDPGTRLGLKSLAKSRLGIDMTEISELIGSGKKQITMDLVPIDEAAPYACADVDMTLRLMRAQRDELDGHGMRALLNDIELPLVPVLGAMELAGILVDTELLREMSTRLAVRMGDIEAEVYQIAGMPFNLNSPQQLAEVLFDRLGMDEKLGRKTRTGQRSVAADVLESLRGANPVIDLVLEHRQLSKLKGTYIDALPQLVHPGTHRVHTSFNQTGAVSGRLSSQDPNLQNIPIRSELGREVRQAFVAPEGWRLLAADYSQVELRIAAHLSGDPGLRAAFAAGDDIHRATAAKVLGIPADEVTSDQRSFAKRVNFGLLYGMGTRSLAEQAGIPMSEAKEFVDAYFSGFPSIKQYIEDTKRSAAEQGYVATLLGRRRYFPILQVSTRDARTNVMQRAAEREAINHPMQGSAADIIKIAMIRVHEALRARELRARMLLQVHDELVLEVPESEVDEVAALVKETMESAYPLDPALKVDVGVGQTWADVK